MLPRELEFLVPQDFLDIKARLFPSLETYVINATMQDDQSPPQNYIHSETALSELEKIRDDIALKKLDRAAILFTIPSPYNSRLDANHPISHAVSIFIETIPQQRIIVHDPLYEEQPQIKKAAFNSEVRKMLASVFSGYVIEEETTPQQKRGENPCVAMVALNAWHYSQQPCGTQVSLPSRDEVECAPWNQFMDAVKQGREQKAAERNIRDRLGKLSRETMRGLSAKYTLDDDLKEYIKISKAVSDLISSIVNKENLDLFVDSENLTAKGRKLVEGVTSKILPHLIVPDVVSDGWQEHARPIATLNEVAFAANRDAILTELRMLEVEGHTFVALEKGSDEHRK